MLCRRLKILFILEILIRYLIINVSIIQFLIKIDFFILFNVCLLKASSQQKTKRDDNNNINKQSKSLNTLIDFKNYITNNYRSSSFDDISIEQLILLKKSEEKNDFLGN